MKKVFKKILAVVLAAAMMSGFFAGCGKKNETITLTIFSELANKSGEQIGWSAKMLKEKFNVVINIIPSEEGVLETRMESGNLGDIVVWGGEDNYKRAVKAGLLYDWEEEDLVQEYGSYIYENMPYALEKNKLLTQNITDGASDTLYGFGHNVATSSENHESFFYTWDIRWDLYKQLNYPQVKTLNDLVDVFVEMKKICPKDDNGNETYAVSLWPDWDGDMVMYVKALATAYYGYDELGVGLYDTDTGSFYDALKQDGPYLECLKFFNKLYQNNLLDPNSMTQTYDEMYEKVQAGGTFWSIFNYSGCIGYNSAEHLAENKMMLSLVPDEATPITYGQSVFGGNRIWSIGANTEYPELCMEIINWLASPEMTMTYFYGPEDLCWYIDDEGYTHFTEFGKKAYFDRSTLMEGEYEGTGTFNDGCLQHNNTIWSMSAINPLSNGESYNYEEWKSNQADPANDIEADWRNRFGVASTQEYMEKHEYKVVPASTFSLDTKADEFKTVWESVTDVIVTYSWKAIYANSDAEFDSIVAEMIKQAEGYGYTQCVEWTLEQAATRFECEEAVR